MVTCTVLGCQSSTRQQYKDLSFHRFPPGGTAERRKWIAATGRMNWFPTKNLRICSRHFEPNWLRRTAHKVLLDKKALPTLLIHHMAEQDVNEPASSETTRGQSPDPENTDPSEQFPPRRTIAQCRFCGETDKECTDIFYIPYLNKIRTSLAFHNINTYIDFRIKILPKFVCDDCDNKLQEIRNYIIKVQEAQERFQIITKSKKRKYVKKKVVRHDSDDTNYDNKTMYYDDESTRDASENENDQEFEIDANVNEIKTEFDDNDNDNKDGIIDSITIEENVIKDSEIKVDVEQKIAVEIENVTLGMNIKEEVVERDDADDDDNNEAAEISASFSVSSAVESLNYITIDGLTGTFSVQGRKRKKIT